METFSSILRNEMELQGYGLKSLELAIRDRRMKMSENDEDPENGGSYHITDRRIYEYLNEISTPPADKARVIMDTLMVEISDADLRQSLLENRAMIRAKKEGARNSEYSRSVSVELRYRKLIPGKEPSQVAAIRHERGKDLYGSEREMSQYVTGLIQKDLKKYTEAVRKERN